MKRTKYYQQGTIPAIALAASAIISLIALTGLYLTPTTPDKSEADIFITPSAKTLSVGEEFTVTIGVRADIPVNVFTGTVYFNKEALTVKSISYNTNVADLWTEEPWYKNGNGTIGFAGGTTKVGGFIGTDTLITINFISTGIGSGDIYIKNARVLEHNGLGSDVEIAPLQPTFFTITSTTSLLHTIAEKSTRPIDVVIIEEAPTADLSGDDRITLADVSIFMLYLSNQNREADLNGDGLVNTTDLSILLQTL